MQGYGSRVVVKRVLAYYLFKMFFEEQMQEKVRVSEMQRQRDYRFREQQFNYDQRRSEMELRMQEMQLEKELVWMQNNPGQTPPFNSGAVSGLGIDMHNTSIPPMDQTGSFSMGLDTLSDQFVSESPVTPRIPPAENIRLKKDGTPDMRYTKGQ